MLLRKIGAFSLSLVCLVAMSSSAYCAGEAAEKEAPSIGELEAFAGTAVETAAGRADAIIAEAEALLAGDKPHLARARLAELAGLETTAAQRKRAAALVEEADAAISKEVGEAPAAPAEARDERQRVDKLLADYVARLKIETEKKKAEAAEYVEEARYYLYTEVDAAKALRLAEKALALDPENKEADDLRTEAGLQLGDEAATIRFTAEKGVVLQHARKQAAQQTLRNTIDSVIELYSSGEYEAALKELRRAEAHVSLLAVYMDMSNQEQELAQLRTRVEGEYERASVRLAAEEKEEASRSAAERIGKMADLKRLEQARRSDEVLKLIEDANFEEARLVLDDLAVQDPSDQLVDVLLKKLSVAEQDYTVRKISAARDRGDLRVEQYMGVSEIPPERLFNYPDKRFWKQVVEQRQIALYPSEQAFKDESPEDAAVRESLQQPVEIAFAETPLSGVLEFLQQVTDVQYVVLDRDMLDTAPVTLTRETTLENALDLIAEQTGAAWQIDKGAVKVGLPESLREYVVRVYLVRDLMLSVDDVAAGVAPGGAAAGAGAGGGGTAGGGGGGTAGGGGGFGQFAGAYGQFGAGGAGAGGARGGIGGAAGGAGMGLAVGGVSAFRAMQLIRLFMLVCGEGTWAFGGVGMGVGGPGAAGPMGAPGGAGGFAPGGMGGGGFAPGGMGGGGAGGFGFGAAPAGGAAVAGVPGVLEGPRGQAFVAPNDPGQIIVLQTAEVHQCIEDLLKEMRSFMKIQIAVDLRFLIVDTDFLREVGFRWPHFSAQPGEYDETGNLKGFGIQSQSYGGIAPFPQPIGTIGLDDEGEPIGIPTGFGWGFGYPGEIPELDFDEDTLTFTFDKEQAVGPALIETGIPFFDSLPGLGLDFGWGGDNWNLSGFFRMGHERNAVKTLAAPRIVLANGQMGSINVATAKDYVDTYDVEDGVLIPQIASISEATLLAVRPIAGPDLRYVFLELSPSISLFDLTDTRSFTTFVGQPGGDGGASGAEVSNFITLPALATDVIRTTVGVPDRGVLVIGGLARSTRTQKESGVPVLSKIPILKRLFTAEGRQLERNTRFILACPQIIIIGEEEERMR